MLSREGLLATIPARSPRPLSGRNVPGETTCSAAGTPDSFRDPLPLHQPIMVKENKTSRNIKRSSTHTSPTKTDQTTQTCWCKATVLNMRVESNLASIVHVTYVVNSTLRTRQSRFHVWHIHPTAEGHLNQKSGGTLVRHRSLKKCNLRRLVRARSTNGCSNTHRVSFHEEAHLGYQYRQTGMYTRTEMHRMRLSAPAASNYPAPPRSPRLTQVGRQWCCLPSPQ